MNRDGSGAQRNSAFHTDPEVQRNHQHGTNERPELIQLRPGAKGCKSNWHRPFKASGVILISSRCATTADPPDPPDPVGELIHHPKPDLISPGQT